MTSERSSSTARWGQTAAAWGLLAAVVVLVILGVQKAQSGEARVAARLLQVETPARVAPPFELETLDGETVALADLADKTVILNFWATWCPPCVEEMPSLEELARSFADRDDVVLLAVSTDDGWEPVRAFFEEKPPFHVLLDAEGELARQYGTTKFPETYVIEDGKITGYIIGPREWDAWYAVSFVRSLLRAPS